MRLLKLLLFVTFLSFSLNAKDIRLLENSNQFVITSNDISEFVFINHLAEINTIRVKKDVDQFVKLIVSGYGENAKKGHAELPVLEKLINIPIGSKVEVKILNKEEKIISLLDYGVENLIFPSQPSLSKGDHAEDIPFYFNESYYNYDDFHVNQLINVKVLGKMRGKQLGRLSIAPFSYNPKTDELKVVTKLEVKVIFKDIDFEAHKMNAQRYYSTEFEHLYKKCVNYLPSESKDIITTYPSTFIGKRSLS